LWAQKDSNLRPAEGNGGQEAKLQIKAVAGPRQQTASVSSKRTKGRQRPPYTIHPNSRALSLASFQAIRGLAPEWNGLCLWSDWRQIGHD